jgi:DNA-binding response OmpR family regulator
VKTHEKVFPQEGGDMPGEHLLVIDDSPTLLKVVESALTQAGYRVDVATDGKSGLELVRGGTTVPDLILLDGLILGSDPVEICGQLAAEASLARVPVIVMATKGDDLEARFARAPNVVDYISKPFSPDALRAVVSQVVGSGPRGAGAGRSSGAGPAAGPSAGEGSSGPTPASQAAVAEALSLSLTAESGAVGLGSGLGEGLALLGNLAAVPLGEVLSMLKERGQTGVLRVVNTSTRAQIEIVFHQGRIDLAAAAGVAEEFLLGRFAAERGDVSSAVLESVLDERRKAAGKVPLFGADLIARGLLTEAQLKRIMARQTSELVYETLRWTQGYFQLRLAAGAEAEPAVVALARGAALAIDVDRLLLEGYRRVDEWRVIGRVVERPEQVYVRDEERIAALARGTFTREELAVLEHVDGRRSVREIVRALRVGSFDASKILFRLVRTKLIRARVEPVAS